MGLYQTTSAKILRFLNSRSGKYGVPFFVLIIGGSFGLKQFAEIRYKYGRRRTVYDEATESGIEMKDPKEVTMEAIYETVKDLDIDNWENKRGPRPWEKETS